VVWKLCEHAEADVDLVGELVRRIVLEPEIAVVVRRLRGVARAVRAGEHERVGCRGNGQCRLIRKQPVLVLEWGFLVYERRLAKVAAGHAAGAVGPDMARLLVGVHEHAASPHRRPGAVTAFNGTLEATLEASRSGGGTHVRDRPPELRDLLRVAAAVGDSSRRGYAAGAEHSDGQHDRDLC
jgi:hypothetical protein